MKQSDINRMLKLAGVKLNETADYDFGHVEPRTHKVTAIASKPGQANLPVRMVNNQGDNPLVVDEEDEDLTAEAPVEQFKQGQAVTVDFNGQPRAGVIQYAGKMFVSIKFNDTGFVDTVLRKELEAMNGMDSAADTPDLGVDGTDEPETQPGQQFEPDEDFATESVVDEGVMDIIHAAVSPETVEKLHGMLAKLGIHDTAILAHEVELTPAGYTKLAHKLTSEAMSDADARDYCKHVMHALAEKLDEHVPHEMDESDQHLHEFIGGDERFGYVIDSMGNVQITDARTGADIYLQGQDAQELLGQLEQAGGNSDMEQHILSQYEHVMDNQTDDNGDDIGLNL